MLWLILGITAPYRLVSIRMAMRLGRRSRAHWGILWDPIRSCQVLWGINALTGYSRRVLVSRFLRYLSRIPMLHGSAAVRPSRWSSKPVPLVGRAARSVSARPRHAARHAFRAHSAGLHRDIRRCHNPSGYSANLNFVHLRARINLGFLGGVNM